VGAEIRGEVVTVTQEMILVVLAGAGRESLISLLTRFDARFETLQSLQDWQD